MDSHKNNSKDNLENRKKLKKSLTSSESEKESSFSRGQEEMSFFTNFKNMNQKSEDNSSFISSSCFLETKKKDRTNTAKGEISSIEENTNKNRDLGDVQTTKEPVSPYKQYSNEEEVMAELSKTDAIGPDFLEKLLRIVKEQEEEKHKTREGFTHKGISTESPHFSNSSNYLDNIFQGNTESVNYPYAGRVMSRRFKTPSSVDRGNSNEQKNYNSKSSQKQTNKALYGYTKNDSECDENAASAYEKLINEKELRDPSEFENMVSDLRITFISWLKKTQTGFVREKDRLMKEKKEFEMERKKILKELEEKRILEDEKIMQERKKLDIEVAACYKQLKKEKEEHRKRFDEERLQFLKEIDQMKVLINIEKEKYNYEYKSFEMEKKKIVDANIATKTMIDINVGGVVFETSRHTLTQQKNSFLEQLLSGRHHVARDKNGRIFLDRDSELFRTILNFLRNPLSIPVPKDLNESESLLKEAQFYGIKFLPFPLLFSIGGFDGVDYLNSVEMLDVSQQCWRMCTPMQTKKAYFGSAVLNNFLYVFGGNNYDYKALFETEVYDRMRDVWFVGSNLNIPRRNNVGTTMNGRIFSIGGFDGACIIPNVEAYDNRMKAWVELAPLHTPRSSAMALVHDNKIIVLGGTNGERLKTVEVYDEKMNQWEKFSYDLLECRSAGTAFSYLNQIYVVGGVDNEHNVLNSVEQYQPFNKRWQFIQNIPEKRMNFGGTILMDSFIVTGGESGEVLNSCYIFSPDKNEWQVGPSLLIPRYGHSMLAINL